ncbi:MAG: 4-(cytidine 5'-diphospho)-2-C-methyl-D-erythritol kinase [Bacteroidota bacterium]|nr:4-(cytidine 5'-diphospho)-2-C-methyl-D-erythritol kinase [Bacteroidota bacterium]
MISFPNCKINLGLNIIGKREDGFHDLETVFFPLPFTDILEIISSENNFDFTVTGLEVSNDENNLCVKAYKLLKKDFPQLPKIKMHLHKVIPLAAGLGGGSADAAFALQLLNKKFQLKLSEEKLIEYALQLGSDCPFFIINKPCFASGRGEKLEPINIDLSNCKIAIVNPGIHIDTTWAFSKIVPKQSSNAIKEIIKLPVKEWRNILKNDFEELVFTSHPEIEKIKNSLYDEGALYASMSGSGSSIFGIFPKERNIQIPHNNKYFYKMIDIS